MTARFYPSARSRSKKPPANTLVIGQGLLRGLLESAPMQMRLVPILFYVFVSIALLTMKTVLILKVCSILMLKYFESSVNGGHWSSLV